MYEYKLKMNQSKDKNRKCEWQIKPTKNSHIRNFLLPVLIIIVYLSCISLNNQKVGKPAYYRSGHFYARLRPFYMAVPHPRVEC